MVEQSMTVLFIVTISADVIASLHDQATLSDGAEAFG
jgi:hypothetical protein